MGVSTSEGARALNAKRWGGHKATRLAQELEARIDELPAGERVKLREALNKLDQNGATK
jgi:hypothetical protein